MKQSEQSERGEERERVGCVNKSERDPCSSESEAERKEDRWEEGGEGGGGWAGGAWTSGVLEGACCWAHGAGHLIASKYGQRRISRAKEDEV